MKCRTCGDSGTIVTVDPISGKKYETKCPLCVAERKMTNEEWFNGLDTEQKAEWLAGIDNYDDLECFVPVSIGKKEWLAWLKSEHKE